jgi:hypothetical protein
MWKRRKQIMNRKVSFWGTTLAVSVLLTSVVVVTAARRDESIIRHLLSETYGSLVMAGDAAGYAELYAEDLIPDRKGQRGNKCPES